MGTGVGTDHVRPRQIGLLSDEALEWLITIFCLAEKWGLLPIIASYTILVGISKPEGGERLIGLLTTFYRIWTRVRRPIVKQWAETTGKRQYFAVGSGLSAIDVPYEMSVYGDAAVAHGWHSGAGVADLAKALSLIHI